MPIKLANTYNPQTEFGRGLSNIANAMFNNEPTDAEMQAASAKTNYTRALTGQSAMQTEKTAKEMAQMDRQNAAREGIAGAFGQMQDLAYQTGDMGVEDPGLASTMAGMPMAVAKYGIQGGLDPKKVSPYAYMAGSQHMSEDQLRRMTPLLGKLPTGSTALTTDRARELQGEKTQRAMDVQGLAGGQAMARTMAAPQKVVGEGGAPEFAPLSEAYGQQPYVKPTAASGPQKVGASEFEDASWLLDRMLGVARDDEGVAGMGGAAPLDPDLENQVLNQAMSLYREGPTKKDLPGSVRAAVAKIVGDPAKLETSGRDEQDKWWFEGSTNPGQRNLAPRKPARTHKDDAGVLWGQFGADPNDPASWEKI